MATVSGLGRGVAELGRLEPVDLREVWSHEAGSFTPWLARPENLSLLGQVLGIELVEAAGEVDVGQYRADIRCRDALTGTWVLIENQLGCTDHSHLGQLLTCAAGLEAITLVWVARSFTERHRATLDWLNRISRDDVHFFGIEIELWRIGNSVPAPGFNVVAKPNDWYRISQRGC